MVTQKKKGAAHNNQASQKTKDQDHREPAKTRNELQDGHPQGAKDQTSAQANRQINIAHDAQTGGMAQEYRADQPAKATPDRKRLSKKTEILKGSKMDSEDLDASLLVEQQAKQPQQRGRQPDANEDRPDSDDGSFDMTRNLSSGMKQA